MSEIKSEVEYVIKTGRQVVEKKQVDFPDKLSAQLDAIKQQFNELGTQVIKIIVCLEGWRMLNGLMMKWHNFLIPFNAKEM